MKDLKFDTNRTKVKNCPCGRSNNDGKFAPLKGFEDKGYCHSCGKTFHPNKEDDSWKFDKVRTNPARYVGTLSTQIERGLMEQTIKGDDNLSAWLYTIFPPDEVQWLIQLYNIGTSKHWNGSTIFWQVDKNNIVRAGKIMAYNPATGRRDKGKFTWVHKLVDMPDYELKQVLFGLHLLDENKTIAVVESEKTAVVGSMYFPDLVWMACGGLQGLTVDKVKPLKGCKVVLFPDANGFAAWTNKADELRSLIPGLRIAVSDFLEVNCTDQQKKEGLDLCDFLLKTPWAELRKQQQHKEQNPPQVANGLDGAGNALKEECHIHPNNSKIGCFFCDLWCEPEPDFRTPPNTYALPPGKYWYRGEGLWTKQELDNYISKR